MHIIIFNIFLSLFETMGMCLSQNNHFKKNRGLDGDNMPSSVAHQLPEDMYHRNQNVAVNHPGMNPHLRKMPREIMEYKADLNDDLLAHNLKHQLSLTKYVSTKRIKNRQIAEHIFLVIHWVRITGIKDPQLRIISYFETFVYAWIQKTFLDIWQIAHQELFVKEIDAKSVRRKVAQQFMFELYQLKEFVDGGMTNICFQIQKARSSLLDIMKYADGALLNIFKKLKEKYPQTAQMSDINQLPSNPTWPADGIKLDLLKSFQSASFSDPDRLNYQTTYQDISFLLNTAIQLQEDFKSDMRELLGPDALGCVKVALIQKEGQKQFNACAVRRIFVKWTQNLLENCPQLYQSRAFVNFIKAKSQIICNFYFKSTIQDTTHKIVIEILSDLLQAAKYNLKDNKRSTEFIFNVYDLLRCKIKRNSVPQVVGLLQKLKAVKVSKSGKAIQVVRIKNRFQTGNRDFLVNFRYGDIIIAEAQLCLDDAHVSKQAKNNHQFCHFIYELQRSIFGPTLELMMQYEDVQRPDISVKFGAQGIVKKRESQIVKNLKKTERICLNGHPMMTLIGNFTAQKMPGQANQEAQAQVQIIICAYCSDYGSTDIPYDYCFKCALTICHNCKNIYHKFKPETYWFSIQNPIDLPQLHSQYDLKQFCYRQIAPLVLFWWPGSSPSDLMKNCISLQYIKSIYLANSYKPKIALADITKSQIKAICRAHNITEYPTLVLFDKTMQAVRKIIGFQWYEVPLIYKAQRQMLQGKSYAVTLGCSQGDCQQVIEIKSKHSYQTQQPFNCMMCFDYNNPKDLPAEYQDLAGVCPKGHHRCIGCSYAALPTPSSYKDCFGAYLSSNLQPKLLRCPTGHVFEHIRNNVFDSWVYNCSICKNKRFFDEQNGIGYCRSCNLAQCTHCLGYTPQTMNQHNSSMDVAFHFTQSTAEESYPCECGKLFKKLYVGCRTSMDFTQNINSQDKSISWKCLICQYQGKDGQLHLGCLCCQAIKKNVQKNHILTEVKHVEICIPCAKKSKILNKEVKPKPKQEITHYKCPKNLHQLITTTQSFGQITFDCSFCRVTYFANTARFYCKQCKISFCQYNKDCKAALIRNFIPTIRHKCGNGHQLTFAAVPEYRLMLCDGCMQVVNQTSYFCVQQDYKYNLCQTCIDTHHHSFVGTVMRDIKEVSMMERAVLVKQGGVSVFKSIVDSAGLDKMGEAIVQQTEEIKQMGGALLQEGAQFLNDLF